MAHDEFDVVDGSLAGDLSGAAEDLASLRCDTPEVPPSGVGQSGSPHPHGLVAASVAAVPRVEGTRNKALFRGALDDRVGKNPPGVLAPGSPGPLDEIGKDRLARLGSHPQGSLVLPMTTIRRQIHVIDCAQFHSLRRNRTGGQ